jgi:hypothetical protein
MSITLFVPPGAHPHINHVLHLTTKHSIIPYKNKYYIITFNPFILYKNTRWRTFVKHHLLSYFIINVYNPLCPSRRTHTQSMFYKLHYNKPYKNKYYIITFILFLLYKNIRWRTFQIYTLLSYFIINEYNPLCPSRRTTLHKPCSPNYNKTFYNTL